MNKILREGGKPCWAIDSCHLFQHTYPRLGITVTRSNLPLSAQSRSRDSSRVSGGSLGPWNGGRRNVQTSPEDKTVLPLTITPLLLRQCL